MDGQMTGNWGNECFLDSIQLKLHLINRMRVGKVCGAKESVEKR